MKNQLEIITLLAGLFIFFSCKNNTQQPADDIQLPKIQVKTVPLVLGNIDEDVVLNGKTVYLKKNSIISPISGYITKMNIKFGDEIQKNDVLFEIQSKESNALQNSKPNDDTLPSHYGTIKVLAPISGVINETITLGAGNFVSEGSLLCTIADNNDLLIQVNVPFQYHQIFAVGKSCKISLPDNRIINGSVFQAIPIIDELSQTQQVLVKLNSKTELPEKMNLTVSFIISTHKSTLLLPKQALLTDETQQKFWVMKIVHDSMAVEIPVTSGLVNDSLVEIFSSGLAGNDLIVSDGGYGLPDSSLVKIIKQ